MATTIYNEFQNARLVARHMLADYEGGCKEVAFPKFTKRVLFIYMPRRTVKQRQTLAIRKVCKQQILPSARTDVTILFPSIIIRSFDDSRC